MRISRDEMLMGIARLVAQRSTCTRKHVGAVISKDGRVLSLGYAGSPAGTPHCIDAGCLLGPEGQCLRTIHAEMNAISWAARTGVSLLGSTLHTTCSPCLACAKIIVNSGVVRVLFDEEYRDHSGIILLTDTGIIVEQFNAEKSKL